MAGIVSLALAACAGGDVPQPCPAARTVPGADSLVRFVGAGRDLTDVLFEARVEDLGVTCDYDESVAEVELRVGIVAVRGPANTEEKATVNYFVAIATLDREVLARTEFDLEIPLVGNRSRVLAIDEIEQRIPLRPGQSGADFVIYVGLGVTADEFRYNLDHSGANPPLR